MIAETHFAVVDNIGTSVISTAKMDKSHEEDLRLSLHSAVAASLFTNVARRFFSLIPNDTKCKFAMQICIACIFRAKACRQGPFTAASTKACTFRIRRSYLKLYRAFRETGKKGKNEKGEMKGSKCESGKWRRNRVKLRLCDSEDGREADQTNGSLRPGKRGNDKLGRPLSKGILPKRTKK